jgi:hypothetical protein
VNRTPVNTPHLTMSERQQMQTLGTQFHRLPQDVQRVILDFLVRIGPLFRPWTDPWPLVRKTISDNKIETMSGSEWLGCGHEMEFFLGRSNGRHYIMCSEYTARCMKCSDVPCYYHWRSTRLYKTQSCTDVGNDLPRALIEFYLAVLDFKIRVGLWCVPVGKPVSQTKNLYLSYK